MSTEVHFWGRIVEALWHPRRVLNRIENGVLDGMPDTHYCIDGASGWIELKCPSEPKRETTALFSGSHKLSIGQANWLLSYVQAGGRAFIGIETDGWVLLVHGKHSDAINTSTITHLKRVSAFSAARPLKPADWIRFTKVLTS